MPLFSRMPKHRAEGRERWRKRYKSAWFDHIGEPLNSGTDALSAGRPFTRIQMAALVL